MKRIIIATSVAFSLFGINVAQAQKYTRANCNKLYTVKMDERAADTIYHGTRKVTLQNLRLLGYIERCQKNPQAQWYVRSYNRMRWQQHFLRVQNADNPTPYSVVASWYDDGGSTACSFHATYGVANRTLPCGSHVLLRHDGNSVTATVEDRGPFIGGRSFDLNPQTKAALGCPDMCGSPYSSPLLASTTG